MGCGNRENRALRLDVRRGRSLALSPVDDWRRASCTRHSCRRHHRSEGAQTTRPYRVRPRGRDAHHLSTGVMKQKFKVGDHVSWNSEAGRVSGTITKVHTSNTDYKGYTH